VPFDDLRGRFETAVATGRGPTLLIGASDWGPALYDAGLVADVSTLASADFLDTINQAALGAVWYKDALTGLPNQQKGIIMYRNKGIIADAVSSCRVARSRRKAADSAIRCEPLRCTDSVIASRIGFYELHFSIRQAGGYPYSFGHANG
jgi:maltose-binding protein MalE